MAFKFKDVIHLKNVLPSSGIFEAFYRNSDLFKSNSIALNSYKLGLTNISNSIILNSYKLGLKNISTFCVISQNSYDAGV